MKGKLVFDSFNVHVGIFERCFAHHLPRDSASANNCVVLTKRAGFIGWEFATKKAYWGYRDVVTLNTNNVRYHRLRKTVVPLVARTVVWHNTFSYSFKEKKKTIKKTEEH